MRSYFHYFYVFLIQESIIKTQNVFLNFYSYHKSNDAAKELGYAEHYYEYSHKKLGRNNKNVERHQKTQKKTYIQ
jgi:hypothetical protein